MFIESKPSELIFGEKTTKRLLAQLTRLHRFVASSNGICKFLGRLQEELKGSIKRLRSGHSWRQSLSFKIRNIVPNYSLVLLVPKIVQKANHTGFNNVEIIADEDRFGIKPYPFQ